MSSEFYNLVRNKNRDVQSLLFAYFINKILDISPDHILAIVAYGSCLNETTRSETSTPDFYVIVDDYPLFHKKPFDRFLNRHLPPNIYHIHTPQASCKYCVISLSHLENEVGNAAKDVYHLGRFSKRMGLVWVRDKETEDRIVRAQMQATLSVTKKILQSLEKNFTLEEFILRGLFLSYEGDVRIEAPDKIQKIMTSEQLYYESIYKHALDELGIKKNESGVYILEKSGSQKRSDRKKFGKFIRQSRVRARLRWPKNIFTVDRWLDYLLAKIERTQNIKIQMTPVEKKFWYIFGWKYFFRLYRKKLIK